MISTVLSDPEPATALAERPDWLVVSAAPLSETATSLLTVS